MATGPHAAVIGAGTLCLFTAADFLERGVSCRL